MPQCSEAIDLARADRNRQAMLNRLLEHDGGWTRGGLVEVLPKKRFLGTTDFDAITKRWTQRLSRGRLADRSVHGFILSLERFG
jgi:hypothetical protein